MASLMMNFLFMISRLANPKDAAINIAAPYVNAGSCPRTTITPVNPASVAIHLCHMIFSLRKILARTSVNSGIEKLITVTVLMGANVRPHVQAAIPPNKRHPRTRCTRGRELFSVSKPFAKMKGISVRAPKPNRRNTTSKLCSLTPRCLVMASFKTLLTRLNINHQIPKK